MKNSNIGSNLTLQKSLDIARLHEQFTTKARQISSEDTSVHVIRGKPQSNNQSYPQDKRAIHKTEQS